MGSKIKNDQTLHKLLDKIRVNENIARYLRYGTLEDRKKAIELYKENINYNIYCKSYVELTIVYMEEMEYAKAISVAEKGIKIYAEHDTYNDLFEMIITKPKMDKKTKKKIDYNNELAERLMNQGRMDEAIEIYKTNVRLVAYTPTTYFNLANIYHYQKKFKSEKDILRLATKRFFTKKSEYGNYFSFKREAEYFSDALKNVESFLNTGKWKYGRLPRDPDYLYSDINFGEKVLMGARKRKKRGQKTKKSAYKYLEKILENGTYTNKVYRILYESYYSDKRYDDAIRVCEKAIEIYELFGYYKKERWELNLRKAIERKEKTKPEIIPSVDKVHQERDKKANKLLKQGQLDKAIKLYEENVTEMTLSNNTYSQLIKIYIESEKNDDAKRVCMQAIEAQKPFSNKKVKQYRRKLFEIIMGYPP